MGSLCSGLFGSQASTTYQAPQAVQNALTDILGRAATQSNQPYPQYTPDTSAQYSQYNAGLLAPMTPNQAQAGQSIAGLQGYTQPNFAAATNLVGAAASPLQMQQFSQNAVNQYMNPYLNDVVGSAVANINQTNAQQQQQVLGNAIQRGAFGGDRAGIAQAELARQQGLANNATIANLLGQGYSQAQGQFNQQQQTDLATQLQNRNLMTNAGLNLANLGTQGQQAALQQAQAQYGYGTAEQQQQQAGLSTAYQQYMNQQAFPYQQLSYYAGLASGAAPALGGTTTGYSPTVSNAGGLLGGLSILGGLSNPGAVSASNPYSAASAGIGALTSGFGSLFGLKDGGRVDRASGGRAAYADAGSVQISPVTQAYNDYNDAVAAGAPYDVLQQLYRKYQQSFQGATPPWKATTPAAATSPTATTATTSSAPGVVAAATGGHGGQDQGGVTARNAAYSPDYTSSNGPVGGGGYGPYDAGGGPGSAFNSGGPLGGLLSGIAAALQGTTNVNKTPYDPNYTGVVSSMGPEMAKTGYVAYDPASDQIVNNYGGYSGIPASTSALDQNTGPSADLAGSKLDSSGKTINLGDLNAAYGLPAGYLGGQLYKESGFNPDATSRESSAQGLAQFTKGTAASMGVDPRDVVSSAYGAATLGQQNAAGLEARGIPATAENLSLAHQFGLAGAAAIIKNPNSTIFDALKTVQDEDKALAAVTGNKYNISDTARSVYDRVSRDFIASMRAANEKGLDIPTRTLEAPSLSNQPENVQQRENAANAVADAASKGVLASGVSGVSGLTDQGGIGNAGYGLGLAGDKISPSTSATGPTGFFDNNATPSPSQNSSTTAGGLFGGAAPSTSATGQGGMFDNNSLDRTVSETDNSSNESGSSLGGRGIGPSVAEHEDSGGEGGGGNNARGGLIHAHHKHHYADGGYAAFHMQYGMPTSEDIAQTASDYAGSGAGVLNPQLEALAAKGVLPSAKGGRIHAQTGVGISADETPVVHSWDEPDDNAQVSKNKLTTATAPVVESKFKTPLQQLGSTISSAVKSADEYIAPKAEEVVKAATEPQYVPDPNYVAPKYRSMENAGPYDAAPAKAAELRKASGTYTKPYEKTQPIDPAKSFAVDQGADNVADKGQEATPAASATPIARQRDVAPGIKEWYNAPPPADMRQIAALNFGANLLAGGDFGSNLARAGHDYANTILAQQDQQRATMRNESESALQRSQGIEAGARTAKERIQPMGLGYSIVSGTGTPDDPIILTGIQGADGQAGGTNVQGGAGGVGGKTAQIVMKQPYSGETYVPDFSDNPQAQQTAAANITMLAHQAKAAMPMQTELAKKNYELSQAEVQAARQDARAAADNIVPYKEVMDAIHVMPQGGPLSPGLTGKARYAAIAGLNDAARAVGIDLGLTDSMSAVDIMNKFATAAANQTSESRAAKWLETTAASLPSIGLNLPTMQKLAANQFTAAHTKQMYANTIAKLAAESDGQDRDMTGHFYAVNPRQNQVKVQNAIYKLMNAHQKEGGKPDGAWIKNPETGRYETPISMFQNGFLTPEQFDKISYDLTGMKNMSSVFGAGE